MININKLDYDAFSFYHNLQLTYFDEAMLFFSGTLVWIIYYAMVFYFLKKQYSFKIIGHIFLLSLLVVAASDSTSSLVLKNLFQRPRPCHIIEIKTFISSFFTKCGGKYGFVSSHASNSLALSLFPVFFLRDKFRFLFLLFPFFVSISRVHTGVHFFR